MNPSEITRLMQNDRARSRGFEWWQGVSKVLGSLEALQDGRCLYTLLATFSTAGLMAASAQSAMARQDWTWVVVYGAVGLFCGFYGSQVAGLQAMDRARGLPVRSLWEGVRDALGMGHRFFLVMLAAVVLAVALLAGLLGLFWLSDLPHVGPWLYGLVVPLTVIALAGLFVLGAGVVVPMAGPAVWSGASTKQALVSLWRIVSKRLLLSSVLVLLLSVLLAVLTAAVSLVVFVGGRLMAEVSVWLLSVEVSPAMLMAGLFGHGLDSLRLDQVPRSAVPHIVAALVGGGVVFALALAMPTLVYLRGVCEIYLLLTGWDQDERV